MSTDSLEQLTVAVREFARVRDWDQFHTPKNLCCALSVEVAELLEHFQWTSGVDLEPLSEEQRANIAHEIADVLIYLVRLGDRLGIDPVLAAHKKLELNAKRYPVELARGSSKKYTEL